MNLIAINGRKWTPAVLSAALRAAQASHQPIEVLAENGQYYKTYSIPYSKGERYPHLRRVEAKPDLLDEILKPRSN